MLFPSKAGTARSVCSRPGGNKWPSAYSYIPGRQFTLVTILPITDIFIDVAIWAIVVDLILFKLNAMLTFCTLIHRGNIFSPSHSAFLNIFYFFIDTVRSFLSFPLIYVCCGCADSDLESKEREKRTNFLTDPCHLFQIQFHFDSQGHYYILYHGHIGFSVLIGQT